MALDRLTKIDGGGISTTSDYRVGIITATKFVGPIEGDVTGSITATDGTFSGNVTIGGTLTYEDVTNIDSVGIITARDGIDCNADLDVDGHTNLDNVSIAGVTTFTGITTTSSTLFADDFSTSGIGTFADIHVKNPTDTRITSIAPGFLILSRDNPGIYLKNNLSDSFDASIELVSNEIRFQGGGNGATSTRMVTTSSGVSFPQDIDVDGHTNLDNVSIAGVCTATTFSGSGASLTSIANANISNSAAIAGSKITPNFGSQTFTAGLGYFTNHLNTTGHFALSGNSTQISFNRASHTPTYSLRLTGGSYPTMNFRIQDTTNNLDRFIIRHGGQIEIPGDVGIGHPVNFSTTNISKFGNYSTLHIKGPSNEGAAIRLQDNGDTADSDDFVIYKNSAAAYLRVNGTDPLIAYMNGAERLRIASDGDLTVTATGDPTLKVIGPGQAQLTLTTTSGTDHCSINFGDNDDHDAGEIRYTNSDNSLNFDTAGAPRLILDSSGNLYPNNDQDQSLGDSSNRWKNLYLRQGGQIQIGDATNTNFFGITEGLVNTYTDQDFMSIYYRNSMRFYSSNNNERVRIHGDGDLQLYNGNIVGNSSHTMEIGDITNGAVKRIRMCQGGEVHFGDTTTSNFMGITEGIVNQFSDVDYVSIYYRNSLKFFSNNNTERFVMESGGHFRPASNNTGDLGTTGIRWRNLYVNDLQLSNEAKKDEGGNDVDGTWGDWTLQEGENDIFMINKRNGKKFKINMTEVS